MFLTCPKNMIVSLVNLSTCRSASPTISLFLCVTVSVFVSSQEISRAMQSREGEEEFLEGPLSKHITEWIK
jgi:hypothetical protein